jgi:hypothetical protein
MASSGMLRRVALLRTDVSEKLGAPIIRVTRIGELGIRLVVTSNRRTLRRKGMGKGMSAVGSRCDRGGEDTGNLEL